MLLNLFDSINKDIRALLQITRVAGIVGRKRPDLCAVDPEVSFYETHFSHDAAVILIEGGQY